MTTGTDRTTVQPAVTLVRSPLPEPMHQPDRCFLCAETYDDDRTAEHVFPKWLLRRYQLWDQPLTFPNGQHAAYRKVRIPCCSACNNGPLSRLESTIERAVSGGFDRFNRLQKKRVFQWMAKIAYEMMYHDAKWFIDIRDPQLGTIVDPAELARFKAFFLHLQSIRVPMRFVQFRPYSLFVFRTEAHGEVEKDFDYLDCPALLASAIRMGEIGIVAVLQDNGAVAKAMSGFQRHLQRQSVTGPQFREAAARIFYAASRINRVPKYITQYGKPVQVLSLPLQGMSSKPVFDPWEDEQYAAFFSFYTGIPHSECYVPGRGVLSFFAATTGA